MSPKKNYERVNGEKRKSETLKIKDKQRENVLFFTAYIYDCLFISLSPFSLFFGTLILFFSLITARDYTHSAFTLVVTSPLSCPFSRFLPFFLPLSSCEQYY